MSGLPQRLALVADVHGNLPALEAVIADLAARGIDRVVNLGDHVSGPLWPEETAACLLELDWPSIAGNHDRMVAFDAPASHGPADRFAHTSLTPASLAWLRALPPTRVVQAAVDVWCCHGVPSDDRLYLLERPEHGRLRLSHPDEIARRLGDIRAPVIACGHSHVPRVVAHDASLIVNPGSVGLQAYADDGRYPHVSETGSPLARYAILELTARRVEVQLVALPYDHHAAAERADAKGRPDWAHALRTGYALRG